MRTEPSKGRNRIKAREREKRGKARLKAGKLCEREKLRSEDGVRRETAKRKSFVVFEKRKRERTRWIQKRKTAVGCSLSTAPKV